MKRRITTVCRKNSRELFKHRTTKIAGDFKIGCIMQNMEILTFGLHAGPFSVQQGTSLLHIALVRNLFMEGVLDELKPRLV